MLSNTKMNSFDYIERQLRRVWMVKHTIRSHLGMALQMMIIVNDSDFTFPKLVSKFDFLLVQVNHIKPPSC